MRTEIYDAKKDPQFQKPFIDIEEERSRSVEGKEIPFLYIHGGFEDTIVRFSFCFPKKEAYKGRFFHYLSPFPGPKEELASLPVIGPDDKIGFTITHGAYFVESNMGSGEQFGAKKDGTIIWRSSAAVAEYSRVVAQRIYGAHRVYGYVYGGSGGGFKTMDCMEKTSAFDGGVPFVIGSPVALPSCMTVRVNAQRILRNKFDQIVDAMEPGGSGDPYAGLDEEEKAALEEATKMGFPLRTWFWHDIMGDGSLAVLGPQVGAADSSYLTDFWTKPGYLGADPQGSAVRDRLQFDSVITKIHKPGESIQEEIDSRNGADDAWRKAIESLGEDKPWLELEKVPQGENLYLDGTNVIIRTGKAAGKKVLLDKMVGNRIIIGAGFGRDNVAEVFELLTEGDELTLDNSDYIAMQTYHRHIVPDAEFTVWDQFRDEKGNPLYPQREARLFQDVANGQTGRLNGKIIVVESLLDESALPWQADWYRRRIASVNGGSEENIMRLWYMDNCIHADVEDMGMSLHIVPYVNAVRQALLDVSDWVERGIEPLPTSNYQVEDGQIIIPETASERLGIQPVVKLFAEGSECAHVKTGEPVHFRAQVATPPGSGKITSASWSFEGESDFPIAGKMQLSDDETAAVVEAEHIYLTPGTYFAVIRVCAERNGNPEDGFLQIKNLCRVRVVVEK